MQDIQDNIWHGYEEEMLNNENPYGRLFFY
jgi:hypothetical protein